MGFYKNGGNKEDGELLRLRHIMLDYGQVKALRDINLSVHKGEVHAIVGEHGAGKSSLGMIISGLLRPKGGEILYKDREYDYFGIKTALRSGIRMVYQQNLLNEYFTVAENIFYTDRKVNRFSFKNHQRMVTHTQKLLAQYGFEIDASARLKSLSLSDRTVVDILKNLHTMPDLLILDESLEKLSNTALNKITQLLRDCKKKGMTILFITHRIDDIYNFADRVSIIKNGEVLITDEVKNIDKITLIRMTYTQIAKDDQYEKVNKEFYHFLKYNEAILQHMPINLIVVDSEYNIKMVNEYCKKYFNLADKAYVNLPLSNLFAAPNENVYRLIQDSLTGKQGSLYQVQIELKNRVSVNNLLTYPIQDGDFVIGHVIIINDVTDFSMLQKQLFLSEKLASVGLLAAGVAHEINNPLEIIYNHLSYIKYNFNNQDLLRVVTNLQNEVSSISNIVSNLVSFSPNSQISVENINDIIHDILNLIKYNANYKHIRIDFETTSEEILISANKNEIRQVILNLLKNSFEAMPDGGLITISTRRDETGKQPTAEVVFRDTGPGIGEENMSNIFMPFFSTKKGDKNNLGLGLSISYAIIERYGGEIRAANLPDRGCQFTIRIPQLLAQAS